MSTFCVTTMGTYTETYNNGLSMDNASTNVLCLNHTATGMNYMWDSGESDSVAWGSWNGTAGQYFVACLQSTNAASGTRFGAHSGLAWANPLAAANMSDGYCSAASSINFSNDVNYWFFGDTPAEDGEDYFHMVLEIQTGIYTHFRTGRVTPSIVEVDYTTNYGTFVSCTGPTGESTSANIQVPFNWDYDSATGLDTLHYPVGTSLGQIDVTPNPSSSTGLLNANWSNVIGCSSFGTLGLNSILARAGTSGFTGRNISAPDVALATNRYQGAHPTPSIPTTAGSEMVLLGTYPGAWCISLETLLPEEIVTIGPSDYIVFPQLRKSSDEDDDAFPGETQGTNGATLALGRASGLQGFIYRKN